MFDGAVKVCEASWDRLDARMAVELGVNLASLQSIWHQLTAARTRRTAHIHREKAGKQYRAYYE